MQGGRGPFFGFGDPFGGFGGFGGFGRQRSMISEFFGGRDPFDDPFFRSPFGGVFESSLFGSNGGPFMNPHASGFLQHLPPAPPQPNLSRGPVMSRGPVIEELNSDDEEDEKESGKMNKENPRKHRRSSKGPIVEDPDDEATEKKSKYMTSRNDMNQMQHARLQPEVNSFTFQSSSVSYGGANGAFYTTSSTRRTGSDGLTYEEFKEADSSTRQATHRVGRAIHDKGHSVTRKLKSDGHVDTMQTLHNLNQDELPCFEDAWRGNAKMHLPGWSEESASRDAMRPARIGDRGGWALPSIGSSNNVGIMKADVGGLPQHSGRAKPDVGNGTGSSRVRSHGAGSSHQTNNNKHY
ncbi:uncharacterized protein LOC131025794 [Salvia miltiorrhiza]|uniref:uncharacterized protein LOC131025794 n=1 Tax=Salvia miltiorrhiza TaxID=226208 RepID=UPI0025ABA2D1|nr:uncharacterized protein LOC131025794 [Salvia miltiorrhiza]XP_057811574.1 uncharacterized protein LOC131025794 [Salvia miltiorrhiza]